MKATPSLIQIAEWIAGGLLICYVLGGVAVYADGQMGFPILHIVPQVFQNAAATLYQQPLMKLHLWPEVPSCI